MEKLIYYIVDVFAEKKYSGNQLAVFRNAGGLTSSEMQKIAQEMNYSETTFITNEDPVNNGYDVRIFTPKAELPFGGHPTLGTAYIIEKEIIKEDTDTVILNLPVGQIPVTMRNNHEDSYLWMQQVEPEFGKTFDKDDFAELLNLDPDDIYEDYPIQEVSTGFFTFIVPLKSLDAVKRAKISLEKLYRITATSPSKAVLVFAPETYHSKNDLNVRCFVDLLGIPEDPATGSANGCLAAYLVQNRFYNSNEIFVRVEQGYEIDRPSLLLLMAHKPNGKFLVHVGGNVIMISKGEFF